MLREKVDLILEKLILIENKLILIENKVEILTTKECPECHQITRIKNYAYCYCRSTTIMSGPYAGEIVDF